MKLTIGKQFRYKNEELEDVVDEFGQLPYDGPIPTPYTDANGRVGKIRET